MTKPSLLASRSRCGDRNRFLACSGAGNRGDCCEQSFPIEGQLHESSGFAAKSVRERQWHQLTVIEDKTEYQKGLTAEQLSERQRVPVDFHAIINPQIDLLTPPDVSFFEGCLSIPRLMAIVARSRSVRVTCLDEHGEQRV